MSYGKFERMCENVKPWKGQEHLCGNCGWEVTEHVHGSLYSFTEYCKANPSQRFWQALRNWSNERYQDERSHIYRGNHITDGGADNWVETLQDTWELE